MSCVEQDKNENGTHTSAGVAHIRSYRRRRKKPSLNLWCWPPASNHEPIIFLVNRILFHPNNINQRFTAINAEQLWLSVFAIRWLAVCQARACAPANQHRESYGTLWAYQCFCCKFIHFYQIGYRSLVIPRWHRFQSATSKRPIRLDTNFSCDSFFHKTRNRFERVLPTHRPNEMWSCQAEMRLFDDRMHAWAHICDRTEMVSNSERQRTTPMSLYGDSAEMYVSCSKDNQSSFWLVTYLVVKC